MKARRILCLIVAVVLMMAATISASAASTATTVITANFTAPTIRVGVPSSTTVYINPSRLQVKLASGFQFKEGETPQIVSDSDYIWNESEVPVEVSVSILGSATTGVTLSPASTSEDESTDKKIFMFFQMKAVEESALESLDSLEWDKAYNESRHVPVTTSTVSKDSVVTLAADKKGSCYGAFTLRGDCIEKPETPWEETDRVNASIAFTFTPVPRDN